MRTNLAGTGFFLRQEDWSLECAKKLNAFHDQNTGHLEQCQGRSQFNEQTAEGREGRFSRLFQSVVFETDRTSRAL